jgi:hypothetical protein
MLVRRATNVAGGQRLGRRQPNVSRRPGGG